MLEKLNQVIVYHKKNARYDEEINSFLSEIFMTGEFNKIIKPGNRVLIKPNLIKESHLYRRDDWEYIITHPTIIYGVIEQVLKILNGTGEIIVADGPQTDSDFSEICRRTNLSKIVNSFKTKTSTKIYLIDLRKEYWNTKDGVVIGRKSLSGDPNNYVRVNLGDKSEFANHGSGKKYYGADYDTEETCQHHSGSKHEYLVAGSALKADVVINLPKMKTHKKSGVTLSLKNLVGINGDKNWLPHYTKGTPLFGGDQYPDSFKSNLEFILLNKFKYFLQYTHFAKIFGIPFKHFGKKIFGDTEKVIRSGNWYGNDTIWRMILDLNKILFYATSEGKMVDVPQRRYITIIDGIIGGESNGPLAPEPKFSGILVAGTNPVAVDTVSCVLMGFDWRKISHIEKAYKIKHFPLVNFTADKIKVIFSNNTGVKEMFFSDLKPVTYFLPHFGWQGHIELKK